MSAARKIVLHATRGYEASDDALLRGLIDRRVELFCAVGVECELWEEVMDGLVVGPAGDYAWHVNTTSHPGESLPAVVEFAEQFAIDGSSEVEIIEL